MPNMKSNSVKYLVAATAVLIVLSAQIAAELIHLTLADLVEFVRAVDRKVEGVHAY